MARNFIPGVHGAESFADPEATPTTAHFSISTGFKLNALGQTINTVASTVANQMVGAVGVPVLASGAESTVTITNSLITTTSFIFTQMRRGTTTPGAGALASVVSQARAPSSGSCVVDVSNRGSAATLVTDYEMWYWIVN